MGLRTTTTGAGLRAPRTARAIGAVAAAPVALPAGAYVLATQDPEKVGWYPRCPTRWLTGLDCPGCGTARGLHDLLQGDVVAAADHNVLLLVGLVWLVVAAVLYLRGRPQLGGRRAAVGWLVVAVAFTVVRNLPGVPFLPAAGA